MTVQGLRIEAGDRLLRRVLHMLAQAASEKSPAGVHQWKPKDGAGEDDDNAITFVQEPTSALWTSPRKSSRSLGVREVTRV